MRVAPACSHDQLLRFSFQTETFIFLSVLFTLIVIGNCAVLATLVASKNRKSRMNFFIMHLAIAGKWLAAQASYQSIIRDAIKIQCQMLFAFFSFFWHANSSSSLVTCYSRLDELRVNKHTHTYKFTPTQTHSHTHKDTQKHTHTPSRTQKHRHTSSETCTCLPLLSTPDNYSLIRKTRLLSILVNYKML